MDGRERGARPDVAMQAFNLAMIQFLTRIGSGIHKGLGALTTMRWVSGP
jgi:hypothetical protein